MKKGYVIGLMTLGCFLITNVATAQSQDKTEIVEKAKVDKVSTEVHLTVEGMTCQAGCADGIDKMLGKTDGVEESKTTFSTASSVIVYDKKVISEKEILELIAEKGFKATVSKDDKID